MQEREQFAIQSGSPGSEPADTVAVGQETWTVYAPRRVTGSPLESAQAPPAVLVPAAASRGQHSGSRTPPR